jgi:UDP-glucose 4-epimerase
MRVVVTGGAGFIGSHVAERLLERGDDVLVVDDLSSGHASNLPAGTDIERISLGKSTVGEAFRRFKPQAVVHGAAQVSVATSMMDPVADARVNVVGALDVLRSAVDAGCSRFVFLSSGGALYGNVTRPASETDPAQPLSPYGVSKWAFERYLAAVAPAGMTWVSLRLANVYGPRQRSDGEGGVVSIFASAMSQGGPVEIHGDGLQTRDFIYVSDVVGAVLSALEFDNNGVFNIGTGRATSVLDLFRALASIASYDLPPSRAAPRPGDVGASVLDIDLARRELRWQPQVELREGLIETFTAISGEQGRARTVLDG